MLNELSSACEFRSPGLFSFVTLLYLTISALVCSAQVNAFYSNRVIKRKLAVMKKQYQVELRAERENVYICCLNRFLSYYQNLQHERRCASVSSDYERSAHCESFKGK